MNRSMPVTTVMHLVGDVPGVRSSVSIKPFNGADLTTATTWIKNESDGNAEEVAFLRQVHADRVHVVPWPEFPEPVEGDALITGEEGIALAVRTADCAPVVLATTDGEGVGIIHAGWKGAHRGIVPSAVESLCRHLGCLPDSIRAALGPTIGPCCYQVDPECAGLFPGHLVHERQGGLYLDLPGVIAVQLELAGLRPECIDLSSAFCTCCGSGAPVGVRFHSHRASRGDSARNVVFILKDVFS